MKRSMLFLAIAAAAIATVSPSARAGNVNFPFNASSEGWALIPENTGPLFWEWSKGQSSTEGALHAWLGSTTPASGAQAYALSPLLTIDQESASQPYVHMDFEFWTAMPENLVLGQVQYQITRQSDHSVIGWAPVPAESYEATAGHILPNALPLAPLLGSGSNSFTGSLGGPNEGKHVRSEFVLDWNAFSPTLVNGDSIQFLFMVGVSGTTGLPTNSMVWELDRVQIDGVSIAPVPEPGSMALAATAAATGLVTALRRRRRRPAA